MPYIVQGDSSETSTQNYRNMNFDYDYPFELDLDPKSKFHEKIRSKIWERASESKKEMSKRYSSWNEIDKILTTYITLDDAEELIKDEDERKPVSIIFPYSYSTLESLLTYMSMAFFQDPIFQYTGASDEDTIGAMLLEHVIRLHCIKSKLPLTLHTIFRDNFAYGIGVGIPGWVRKEGRFPVKTAINSNYEQSKGVEFVNGLLYEGNDLTNIDPYLFLPDPSVSIDRLQDGEFVGWIDRTNYMKLLSEEGSDKDNEYFNVKYLRGKTDKRSSLAIDNSKRELKFGGTSKSLRQGMTSTTNPVDVINMYITLIPKEWGLTNSEYPEKWFFRLAADDVIITCQKADHNHNMYPIAAMASEYDGYSITPIGRLEIIQGLQGTLDWLFNSHIANVRKSINDMFVVDPHLINIEDLKDPRPGKLIRLNRPAWGHGVKDAVQQLSVNDITRLNIADSSYITQWMDRVMGTDQSMSGAMRTGGPERLTKGEFQGTRGSAISRLQRIAMIASYQFMQDIGTMFAVHTQQYMTKETYIKMSGRYEEQLRKIYNMYDNSIPVSPYDISVNYDIIVKDGAIPGGNFSESWVQLFNIIGSSPELMQQFDVTRIFMYIASQLGAKNVEDFKRNVDQIGVNQMPDQQVLQQAQAGNIIPTGSL